MYLILISCLPVATHGHNYLVHSNTTVVSSLLWKQSLFAWKRRRVLGKQCNPTRPLWPCGNGWFSGPSYSSELVFFRSRKGLSITCLQFCIRNCRWPWLCMSSDTCEITPGSANLSVCFSKRVSNSWLPLPASSVEKEPNGIRIQKLPGRQVGVNEIHTLRQMVFGTVITTDQCTWRSAFSLYWLLREMSSLRSPLNSAKHVRILIWIGY